MSILFKYRYAFFSLLILCAVLLSPYLKEGMVPNNSLRIWFYQDDPNLKAYEESFSQFGNDEVIVIYYETREENLLSKANLSLIKKLTRDIQNVDHIHKVYSLIDIKDVQSQSGQLQIRNLIPDHFELTESQIMIITSKLLNDPVFGGVFISKNKRGVLITAQLEAIDNVDQERDNISDTVIDILDHHLNDNGIEYHIGGVGIIYTFLNKLTADDASILVSMSYVIMFVLIAILLRNFIAVIITVLVIALTSTITLGLFGATGHQINLMTVVLPTLIAILSIADCVHVINHCRSVDSGERIDKARLSQNLSYIFVPCFFTSLTTFIGFLSLNISKMQILRELGLFSALAVAIAFIVSFITIPVFLGIFKLRPISTKQSKLDNIIFKLNFVCGKTAVRHPYQVIAVFGFLFILFAISLPFVQVDIRTFEYFPKNMKVVRDNNYIANNYGFYFPIEFTLKTQNPIGVSMPDFIKRLHQFQNDVEEFDDIGRSFTLADPVLKVHRILENDHYAYPDDPEQISSILEFLSMADNEALNALINDERDYTHFFFNMNFKSGKQARTLIDRIVEKGEGYFGPGTQISAVGYWPLYLQLVDYALETQIKGFTLSFVVILLVIFIIFKDWKIMLLAIPPNLFPVFLMGFALALTGIDLDFGTVSISVILLGIVIDDTIHLLYRIKQNFNIHGVAPDTAIINAVTESGQTLLITTVVLVVGFMILVLASVKTVTYFGGFLALSLSTALIADLLFMPALYYVFLRHKVSS